MTRDGPKPMLVPYLGQVQRTYPTLYNVTDFTLGISFLMPEVSVLQATYTGYRIRFADCYGTSHFHPKFGRTDHRETVYNAVANIIDSPDTYSTGTSGPDGPNSVQFQLDLCRIWVEILFTRLWLT